MPQRSVAGLAGILRVLRVGCVLAAALALAACGRCGDFLSSQDDIAACRSDTPPQ
jgi:hypothetical protein